MAHEKHIRARELPSHPEATHGRKYFVRIVRILEGRTKEYRCCQIRVSSHNEDRWTPDEKGIAPSMWVMHFNVEQGKMNFTQIRKKPKGIIEFELDLSRYL